MVKATPPFGKHEDSVWQKLYLSMESINILCGKSYTSLKKKPGFCLAKATPASRKHKDSVCYTPFKEKIRNLCGKSYTSLRKAQRFCVA